MSCPLQDQSQLLRNSSVPRDALIEIIRKELERDYHACDFKLGIAWAACSSLKRVSVFCPGPPDHVCSTNEFLSSLSKLTLRRIYDNPNLLKNVSDQTLKILYWLFASSSSVKLTQLRDWRRVIWPPELPETALRANLTFKIHHSSQEEEAFENLKKEYGSWGNCYHGTSLDRVYSILHRGLIPELFAGEGLFGDGAYFSTDPRVSFSFVKSGVPWPHTLLADYYGCMFVCEVIKHPSVKFSKNEHTRNSNIPETYLLVHDSCLIQTKYIVVFYSTSASNKYIKIVALYVCILVVVMMTRSTWFKRMIMKYNIDDYLD